MKTGPAKIVIFFLFNIIILTFSQFGMKDLYAETGKINRLAGADRYLTSVAISREGWPNSDYAVLARGDSFADALCAGPLAAKYDAPILLTGSKELNAAALLEIQRLGVKHLYITGGQEAISPNIEDALKIAGITDIKRIFGRDRYETSEKIARELNGDTVVLATGEDYPDALSISVPAAKAGMPILLTYKNNLPEIIEDYFAVNTVSRTYIIGGTGVISAEVEKLAPSPTRLSGSDRYQTNLAVLKEFTEQLNFDHVYAAVGGGPRGNEFADALTGSVLAAKMSSPLLLVAGSLPEESKNFLQEQYSSSIRVTGLGGEDAIKPSILESISSLGVTANGNLDLSPNGATAGNTQTIVLTYTLGEDFVEGSLEFQLPDSIPAAIGRYAVDAGDRQTTEEYADSGRKIILAGITAAKGGQITLTLVDNTVPETGNYLFRVVADADGQSADKLPSSADGEALKPFVSYSAQLASLHEQLISLNRPYTSLKAQGIVIHSTASPGSTAQKEYQYFNSHHVQASAHYVADWDEIIQMIPEGEVAWHAGPSANKKYLSIEMCEPKGQNPEQFQKVWDNAVLLAADACIRYGWNTVDNVFSHNGISIIYKETDHTDPMQFLKNNGRTWSGLLQAIDAKIAELK